MDGYVRMDLCGCVRPHGMYADSIKRDSTCYEMRPKENEIASVCERNTNRKYKKQIDLNSLFFGINDQIFLFPFDIFFILSVVRFACLFIGLYSDGLNVCVLFYIWLGLNVDRESSHQPMCIERERLARR